MTRPNPERFSDEESSLTDELALHEVDLGNAVVTPAATPKRRRTGSGVVAKGTVSDLVAEQRR